MTTTEDAGDTVHIDPSVRRQPVALCVLVGAAVVIGWVLYRHYLFGHLVDRVLHWDAVTSRFWLFYLVETALLSVPYALALLAWGRDRDRRVVGAFVALGTGAYVWALGEVFANVVWGAGDGSGTSLRIFDWANLLVPAALVPLAWGLARRPGRGWVRWIVVGPVVAAILRELELHVTWWRDRASPLGHHHHWQLAAAVFVTPYVAAVLACWWLDSPGRRTPEMGSGPV
jgi:hypothetical protein